MNLNIPNKYLRNFTLTIAIVILIGTLTSNIIRSTHNKGDFVAIYQASEHALKINSLNDPESLGYYPPSARPFFLIFAVLPKVPAMALWWLISVFLYCLAFYLSAKYLIPYNNTHDNNINNINKNHDNKDIDNTGDVSTENTKTNMPKRILKIISITFLLSIPWLISDLNVGNVSTIVLMSILVSYILHIKNRQILSGLVLAIGISTKLIPIFLLIFYAIRKKWKQTIITLIILPIVGIIPGILIFSYKDFTRSWKCWKEHAFNIRTAKYIITKTHRLNYMNQAWPNVLTRALHHIDSGHRHHSLYVNFANLPKKTILIIWYIFAATSFAIWIYAIKPPENLDKHHQLISERLAFCLVPPIVLWFSPHMLSYYMTILIPSLTLIVWATFDKNTYDTDTNTNASNELNKKQKQNSQTLKSKLKIILLVYLILCLSPAFPLFRALGSYQFIVLLCFIGVYMIIRDNSKRAKTDL